MIVESLAMEEGGNAATLPKYGFVGNNAVVEVNISDLGSGDYVMRATGGDSWLKQQDNFVIESIRLACPHGYRIGGKLPGVRLQIHRSSEVGSVALVETGSSDGQIYVPDLNVDFPLNIAVKYADYTGVAGERFQIWAPLVGGSVSQVGMDAVLNGVTVRIVPVLRIRHNIPLEASPV